MTISIDIDDLLLSLERSTATIDPLFFLLLTGLTYTLPIFLFGHWRGFLIDIGLTPFIFPWALGMDWCTERYAPEWRGAVRKNFEMVVVVGAMVGGYYLVSLDGVVGGRKRLMMMLMLILTMIK